MKKSLNNKVSKDLRKVQKVLSKIPYGKVMTYKSLARAIKKPKAWRYVGTLLGMNPMPNKYPCFKIIKSNGLVGKYSLGVKEKISRLRREHVIVRRGRVEDFKKILI